MLSDLSRDFRYALRALLRAPTFAATVIATLSLDRLCHGESLDELDLEGILGFAERVLPRASERWRSRRSIRSSGCSSRSLEMSRSTEIHSIEPPHRHRFSSTGGWPQY